MAEKINVTLSPDRLQVTLGESVATTATIKNAGDVVEAYSITVEGIDPQWCTLSVSSVSLFPGDQEQVRLTIQPPKASASRAGPYNVIIKVASNRDPTLETTAQLAVEVGRFLLFDLDLTPKKTRGRKGSYKVSITNHGNIATTYTFAGKDPEDICRFDFKQSSVTVEPGATAEVPVVVNPKKKPFTGRARTYSFKLMVTSHASEAGETKTVEAQLECRPLIPVWAITLGSVAVVAAIAVIVVLFVMCGGKAPVISSVTADPATVGVNRDSTITCIATDADGDTLTYAWSADDGTIVGTGNVVTWTAPAAAGEYTISVTVDDGTGRTADGSVVVTAVITTGTIEVNSDPTGATVYLDGEDTGNITPYVIADVEEGEYTIKLTKQFQKDHEDTVTVTAGETTYVNWELDPAPPHPVTIQPGPADGKDSFVGEFSPNDAAQTMPPFHLVLGVAGNSPGEDTRSYLQFDLSGIPDTAIVTSASLGLYHDGSDAGAVIGPVGAYQVTSDWNDTTLTWNNQPISADTAEDVITVTAPAPHSFISWDIANLVQGWHDGSITNYGVMLRDTDESSSEGLKAFYSADWGTAAQRPKLEVTYYDPAP
ncbi:MAG: DNRLRE domain-containing protein [Dehalococcoidia bacterium]